jgi:hypothetical protein
MALVVMQKPDVTLAGDYAEVVVGASARPLTAKVSSGDVTGWTARVIGSSDDLPEVFFDVDGSIQSPASAGTFEWKRVGDWLTQIGDKTHATFTCRVEWTTDAGLVDYSDEFAIRFVVPATGEDTNMNAAAVQALIAATPGHPFEFPFSGDMKMPPPLVGIHLTSGQSYTLFDSPVGTSGVIRNIAWIVNAANGLTTKVPNLFLSIYYDGSASPSVSIPIFTSVGLEHPNLALNDLHVSTDAFEITSGLF